MSSVPRPTLTSAGFIIPSASDILAGVMADMNAAFGGDLNPDLRTPQGQLAQSLAAIIDGKNGELLALFNGFDPNLSFGKQQDALARIYFLERDPARSTSVNVVVTGLPGVVIPAGSLAQGVDGRLYAATGAITIDSDGSTSGTFQCLETGPIQCAAGNLSKIYQAIPGWDTITNPTDGSPGNDVESPRAFEQRRQQSVAFNAVSILDAILGKVLAVDDVLDAYVTENASNSPVTVGGVTLAPNSLYVAVSGGLDADVARAIWSKKAPGCSYNGNTTVNVTDTDGGYATPPVYPVTFTRPADAAVKFLVNIASGPGVPSDYAGQIRAAIIAAFSGSDGGPRARIGSTILALRFYQAVTNLGAWAQVVSIKVGKVTADADSVTMDIDERPITNAGQIGVVLV